MEKNLKILVVDGSRVSRSMIRSLLAMHNNAEQVQVAAVSTNAEAISMVQRLRDRGYDARIDGTAAPFRVRFGRFPTRAAAAAALDGYKTKEKAAAFLVEVPRG